MDLFSRKFKLKDVLDTFKYLPRGKHACIILHISCNLIIFFMRPTLPKKVKEKGEHTLPVCMHHRGLKNRTLFVLWSIKHNFLRHSFCFIQCFYLLQGVKNTSPNKTSIALAFVLQHVWGNPTTSWFILKFKTWITRHTVCGDRTHDHMVKSHALYHWAKTT